MARSVKSKIEEIIKNIAYKYNRYISYDNAYTALHLREDPVGIEVEDGGVSLDNNATALNFTGDGVTVSGTGSTKTVNITGEPSSEVNLAKYIGVTHDIINVEGSDLVRKDIVITVGCKFDSESEDHHWEVRKTQGTLPSMPNAVGILNTDVATPLYAKDAITTFGYVVLTSSDTSMVAGDKIYLTTTGIGSSTEWVMTTTETSNLIGEVIDVDGDGNRACLVNFSNL